MYKVNLSYLTKVCLVSVSLISISASYSFGSPLAMPAIHAVSRASAQHGVHNPKVFMNNILNNLQSDIKSSGVSYHSNPKKLYAIVRKVVLPNIAVDQLAGTVVGRSWRVATKSQKKHFIDAFSELLTRSYAVALLKVSDYQIKLLPLRGSSWKIQSVVGVAAKIINKSTGSSSDATFYLEKSGNSWKIFDLAVEGVSIVKNFKEQFSSFKSLDKLTAKIESVNKAAEK
jgi:phospholipid transport system substrate-binding protein